MNWSGKHVSVVGLGKSNLALIRYLVREGAIVTARDRKTQEELGPVYDQLSALGVDFRLGRDYLKGLRFADGVFLTPGMPKDLPEILDARRAGVPISTEINLFFERCAAPIIGVTGSSGKTTTTTLIGAILEATGHKVYVGGNIGRPLIELVDTIEKNAVVVLELSSFQLELVEASPQVAVVTNISPNHLDIHRTMEAYVSAKERIYQFQRPQEAVILNRDDPATRAMAAKAPSRVFWFSRRGEVDNGAFICDGRVILSRRGEDRSLIDVCAVADIRLRGEHNLENVLAACAVGYLLGATAGTMREVVTSFTGVAHRLELVREAGGVRYYNDSIATSPARAIAGLRSFDEPVLLIAGGYDKQLPLDEFAEVVVEKAKAVFLIGQTARKIQEAILKARGERDRPRIVLCESLDEAVREAHRAASPGDVVLLSPACASYDMFQNFEQRGERFRKLVHMLTEEEVPKISRVDV
jgi:UDP-N-acetylmuramoylalanine--D-glutamate ligase